MSVRRLGQDDCLEVARLHMNALPTPFAGRSGEALLRIYYRSVTAEQGAVGYVAVNSGAQVIGFVCGVWNPGQLRRHMVSHYGLALLWWGSGQLLQKPQFLASVPGRLRRAPDDAPARESVHEPGYELRPIVVAETARGSGAARMLVETLLQDARKRGFKEMYLYVETENLAARKFYAKAGFAEVDQEELEGRCVIRCRCDV
jgi:ribosomal protein S18 acetylase RimI-like enzyme